MAGKRMTPDNAPPAEFKIVEAARKRGLANDDAVDVGFHMYDWLRDLEEFWAFTQDPDSLTLKELDTMLANFLIHAPNHIAAAAKLYTDCGVQDVFGVGACSSDEEE
tara:strand:+ start:162135 stop:162455 length:321 start_codon:yes stop_codon:yes gene_type:complete